MPIIKKIKDRIFKFIFAGKSIPVSLFELSQYFRFYEPINFKYEKTGDLIIATSTNFRYGSIVTSGRNEEEVDKNIKDAILTAFGVPSSYSKEAKIQKVGERQKEYAFA